MDRKIEILPDKAALIERSRQLMLDKIHGAIADRDRCTLALAGGGTPKPLYEALANETLPLDKIHIFWSDERYVPPDHSDSNQLMARQAWLDRVNFPEANIHPMPTQSGDPEADARLHEHQLHQFFQTSPGEFPSFDFILLGIGDDGHTASLFPHTDALTVRDRLVTVGNKDGQPRITFTIPFINSARCVAFVVAGAGKQAALSRILAESGDNATYPARHIQPQGELWWVLDQSVGAAIASQ